MDEWQAKKITEYYPELASIITVTGQPLFDALSHEEVERTRTDVRARLKIPDGDTLISIMYTADPRPGEMEAIADSLSNMSAVARARLWIAVRRHPRNKESYEELARIFSSRGLRLVDTMTGETQLATDAVRVASDVVINTVSTEGTAATAYGIPAIHVIDPAFGEFPEDAVIDVPPAETGASILLTDTGLLTQRVEELMDPESALSQKTKQAIQTHPLYTSRGDSARKVADVARRLIAEGR